MFYIYNGTYIDYFSNKLSVELTMSMVINYFYENFSSEGKPLHDTLFLSFSSLDTDTNPLQEPLLSPTKNCSAKLQEKDYENIFSIEGC